MSTVMNLEEQLCVCNILDEHKDENVIHISVVSGFLRLVAENCSVLGYYAAGSEWYLVNYHAVLSEFPMLTPSTTYRP
jgi:hypothetical protein